MADKRLAENVTGLRATGGHRTLTFGVLSIDVGLTPLTDNSARIAGHLVAPTGGGVKQRYVDAEGNLYERSELGKAFTWNGVDVELTDGELDELKLDGDGIVELTHRIAEGDLPYEYVEKTQLVFPTNRVSLERYKLLETLLRDKGWALIGKAVDHGSTKGLAICWSPVTETLVAHVLTYDARVRWKNVETIAKVVADAAEPSDEMLAVAEQVFGLMGEGFDFSSLTDDYGEALEAAVAAKAAGHTPAPAHVTKVEPSTDLLDALKASLAAQNAPQEAKPKAKSKSKAKSAA